MPLESILLSLYGAGALFFILMIVKDAFRDKDAAEKAYLKRLGTSAIVAETLFATMIWPILALALIEEFRKGD